MENNIPLCPIAGWTIGPINAYDAVTIKLTFLTNPLQPIDEANHTPQLVLTTAQALEMSTALQKAAQQVQSGGFQAAPGPRH